MAYNEKQKEYTMNYMKEKLDEIKFRVPKGQKAIIREHAESMGDKLTPFIIRAINETMERDKALLNNQSIGTLKTEPTKQPIVMDDTKQEESPNKQYKQLTDSELSQIDLHRLVNDPLYQVDMASIYGMNALAELLEKAREQSTSKAEE
ncbi:MAG: hypothetical protein KH020_16865 [Clostridiales bacterium]|nr:hypothetical protein [Clostridiales bacterium]